MQLMRKKPRLSRGFSCQWRNPTRRDSAPGGTTYDGRYRRSPSIKQRRQLHTSLVGVQTAQGHDEDRPVGVRPARRGPPRPRGSAFGLVPAEVLALGAQDHLRPNAGTLSSHQDCSRLPEPRLMTSKFCTGLRVSVAIAPSCKRKRPPSAAS